MQYRVDAFKVDQGQETEPERKRASGGGTPAAAQLFAWLTRADPTRLASPAGERVVDIYRRAYVNGGLTPADARRAQMIWLGECLRSVPAILLFGMPGALLLALALSGITVPPVKIWTAVLYTTGAAAVLLALWHATVGPRMHAAGVPVALRTAVAFCAQTIVLLAGHAALHRLAPDHFSNLSNYLPLLLLFQVMLNWVCHFAFDIHIDYTLVTRRWTDTPLQRLLPYDKRGKLVFLRASDHYVIVRTTKGEHELRMRFADALDRLGSARGLQVHRSFWVAQDYLSTPRKAGRRMVMRVEGVSIPISSTYRDAVVRNLDLSSQA